MSRIQRILIVDDERVMIDYLSDLLKGRYLVDTARSYQEATAQMRAKAYDLIIADLQLGEQSSGLALIEASNSLPTPVPVVVMTAYASVEMAVEAIKKGAVDFLPKPFGPKELENILTDRRPLDRQRRAGFSVPVKHMGSKRLILGKSEAMRRVYELVENVANTRATIMLTGESGTGKELIASAAHRLSQRSNSPFIKVNCAAITDTLLESTLFGHEKGAFTGAIKRTPGKFELANGGTLLLDEISEMKHELQSKLLRVLQEREFELIGGTVTMPVDVRIIATSNRNLREEVKNGNFREDLYFRLNVVPIRMPPLRDRPEDIPELLDFFLDQSAAENCVPRPSISPALVDELKGMAWPGNVRQLQNSVERAVVLSRGRGLTAESFMFGEDMTDAPQKQDFERDITIKEMEKRMIIATLGRFRENRTQAAKHLGISVRTLRNKLNLYRQKSRSTAA